MNDRFTQASSELTDNNPYICTSCEGLFGHPTIEPRAEEHAATGPECLINCDPMPFGD